MSQRSLSFDASLLVRDARGRYRPILLKNSVASPAPGLPVSLTPASVRF